MARRICLYAFFSLLVWGPVYAQEEPDPPPLKILTPRDKIPPPPEVEPPVEDGDRGTVPPPHEEGDVGRAVSDSGELPGTISSFAVGSGVIFWFTDVPKEPLSFPLVIETRTVIFMSPKVGLHYFGRLEIHDWKTIGAIWGWYFTPEEDSPDGEDTLGLKILLWPGLLIAPLLGSNMLMGLGVAYYNNPGGSSFFVDAGVQGGLYFRISDCDFIMDVGMGVYAGLGADFTETFGFSLRGIYGFPIFNGLIDQVDQHIVSATASFHYNFE